MQVIASYLMYLPRLYITCLTLLSKLFEREREVEHTISIYKPHHLLNKEYTNKKKNIRSNLTKKKLYGHNNNNYLDEDMPIMCFDPCKIIFSGYDILQVHTKSSGKFNFLHYFFDNIALLLRKHPWNWVYINLFSIGMKLDDVFHCMVAFLNVFASFHNFIFLPP